MNPPCTRMYTHPFFEATTPGAAPGPPVKTGARVRHFRGCKKEGQRAVGREGNARRGILPPMPWRRTLSASGSRRKRRRKRQRQRRSGKRQRGHALTGHHRLRAPCPAPKPERTHPGRVRRRRPLFWSPLCDLPSDEPELPCGRLLHGARRRQPGAYLAPVVDSFYQPRAPQP